MSTSKVMLATRLRLAVGLVLLGFVAVIVLLGLRASDSLLGVRMQTTVDQVKGAAASGKIRYSGNGYLWTNDMRPTMVMHPISWR